MLHIYIYSFPRQRFSSGDWKKVVFRSLNTPEHALDASRVCTGYLLEKSGNRHRFYSDSRVDDTGRLKMSFRPGSIYGPIMLEWLKTVMLSPEE